jgi:hypothetical protein
MGTKVVERLGEATASRGVEASAILKIQATLVVSTAPVIQLPRAVLTAVD